MAEKKPVIDAIVKQVIHVTVAADGVAEALIGFEIEGQANLQLRLTPELLANLEAMLAKASLEQAKHQPLQ
jgi:hypothetical protein